MHGVTLAAHSHQGLHAVHHHVRLGRTLVTEDLAADTAMVAAEEETEVSVAS